MHLWVDADACPGPIKEILFRAARRTGLPLTLVANHAMAVPASPHIHLVRVGAGFDVADDYLVERVVPGDLLVTQDIPLAAQAIERGAVVLTPRGERLTGDNIKPRLSMRDFLESLRASGVETGGAAPLGAADRKAFADQLDRLLTRAMRP